MKIYDQHVHSYYSFDNDQDIKEYLLIAREKSLPCFVLTDHVDLNYLDEGKDLSFDFEKQHIELDKLQKEFPEIKILKGVEIGYKPNELERINKILKSYDFDVVNLSLHESDGMDYYFKDKFIELGIDNTLKQYFKRIFEMVTNYDDFDVLSHIDYGFKTAYLIDNSLRISSYEDELKEIITVIINKDKTLELNTKVQMFLPIEHTKYLLNLYRFLGGKNITLSSDAHSKDRLCADFEKYLKIIKEVGFAGIITFKKRNKTLVKFD